VIDAALPRFFQKKDLTRSVFVLLKDAGAVLKLRFIAEQVLNLKFPRFVAQIS
jgi:hypothetical protein